MKVDFWPANNGTSLQVRVDGKYLGVIEDGHFYIGPHHTEGMKFTPEDLEQVGREVVAKMRELAVQLKK